MPTYEYACTSCGEHVEVVQSFTDEPLTTCPACGGTLRKVFAPVGIVLKGSGFYKTDSRAAGGTKAGAGRGEGDRSTSSAEGTKDGSPTGDAEKGTGGQKGTGGGKESGGGSGSSASGSGEKGGASSSGSSAPAAAASN